MNITIHRNDAGAFFVLHGDKFADCLTYEEMLGLVALIATPANPRAVSWLKTGDEWRDSVRSSALRMAGVKDPDVVDAEYPGDEPLTATEMAARADAADARVVGDWRPYVCPDLASSLPIRRQDLVLQVGDVLEFSDGLTGTVRRVDYGDQPCWTEGAYCTTLGGIAIGTTGEVARAISVNGRPIIED